MLHMHVYLQLCRYYNSHNQLAVTGEVICQLAVSILISDLTSCSFSLHTLVSISVSVSVYVSEGMRPVFRVYNSIKIYFISYRNVITTCKTN